MHMQSPSIDFYDIVVLIVLFIRFYLIFCFCGWRSINIVGQQKSLNFCDKTLPKKKENRLSRQKKILLDLACRMAAFTVSF